MLPLEKSFKDIILEHVRGDPLSISAISRHLEKEGHPMHRLILTGYLRAMHDFGYLKEKDIPPSKVYQAAVPKETDLYGLVGEVVRSMDLRPSEQVHATIYTLNRLFRRPVFSEELESCGFSKPHDAPPARGAQVQEARRLLGRSGFRLPRNDPAYEVTDDHSESFNRIISGLIVEGFGIRGQMAGGTQLRLEGL
jgi:hypothetical protein